MRVPFLCWLSSFCLVALSTGAAQAQGYPDKPVRWIIDFPAAGVSDLIARTIGQKLSEQLGQSIVYDNRPGANGIIANELAAKAPPDGYTMGFISQPFSLQMTLNSKLTFGVKDFAPICLFGVYPSLLVVTPKLPAQNLKEFVAYAKGRNPPITYASSGAGGAQHVAMELFRKTAGFAATHVPYNGSGPGLVDLMGGRIDAVFVNVPGALAHVRAGRVRVLALAGPVRSPLLPEIPTFNEIGVLFEVLGYAGAVFPAGTPAVIVNRMNAEMVKVLKLPETRERIVNLGGEPRYSTPEDFGRYIREDIARWAPVIRESGATTQN